MITIGTANLRGSVVGPDSVLLLTFVLLGPGVYPQSPSCVGLTGQDAMSSIFARARDLLLYTAFCRF